MLSSYYALTAVEKEKLFICQYSNLDKKQIPNYSSCSVPDYPLFYSPKRSSYLAVVAIDFGTTYSGFAFSFNKDQGKDSIFMNMDWVNEHGSQTSKTPTCLLLKPDLSFDSFGYDAIEKYAGLEGDDGEKEHFFFKHFKMTLHNDEVWCVSLAHELRIECMKDASLKCKFCRSLYLVFDCLQVRTAFHLILIIGHKYFDKQKKKTV